MTIWRTLGGALLAITLVACDAGKVPPIAAPSGPTQPTEPTEPTDTTQPTDPADTITPVDTTDPVTSAEAKAAQALARAVLDRWLAKDVAALTSLSGDGANAAAALVDPGTPRYESLFGAASWRYAAVAVWNHGALGAPRGTAERILVKFANLAGTEAACVDLRKAGDAWTFLHLIRIPEAELAAFGRPL